MSVAKMLEYQKIDRELYTLEKDFSALMKNDKFAQVQNAYKEKIDAVPKLNKELDDIITQINDLLKKISDLDSNKAILDGDFDNYNKVVDFSSYEKSLNSYEDDITWINRETSRLYKRLSDIGYENKKVMEQTETLQGQLLNFKRSILGKQQEMRVKATPIAQKLLLLAKEIEPAMMAKYKACRDAKVFPVFIPYTDEGNCAACGMFVKIEVDKHLINKDDYIECPHCRRILFKR